MKFGTLCHVTCPPLVSAGLAGRFEARIGIAGSKHIYLGLFENEIEAARAYDRAIVRLKGLHASTNLYLSDYSRQVSEHELKRIQVRPSLPNSARVVTRKSYQSNRELNASHKRCIGAV